MKSYPTAREVLEDLGDKVVHGFARSVVLARADLADYREAMPGIVARSTERGLANWIHDQLWYHISVQLADVAEVSFVDREPRREIAVGTRYLFRVKRHTQLGGVSTYPTQTALDFLQQVPVQEPFDGMERIKLIVGYVWDPDLREVGPAVISLRSDRDEIKWIEELPDGGAAGATPAVPLPPRIEPPTPSIDVPSEDDETGDTST